jgi:hypothetical protein
VASAIAAIFFRRDDGDRLGKCTDVDERDAVGILEPAAAIAKNQDGIRQTGRALGW